MSMFTEWNITARNLTADTAAELREKMREFAGCLNDYEFGAETCLSFETWSHFAVDDGREILVDFSIAHPEAEIEALVKSDNDGPIKYHIHDNLLQTYTPVIAYELASEERIGV
jgi:hypothetical protein